ncbi:unnamed protein product [Darwinula stevensoni]|uniref:MYND-type domain-containing protein n=1 Tax=Darwinula stevensoni TaxID=69355 RepID=A0A7R9A6L7_9CRUS|nr:unnamed protein product [Darwinula stevensoni]CAG0888200.1 unnamed protein product [Darwinula stevensoni]
MYGFPCPALFPGLHASWVEAVKRQGFSPGNGARICSIHFKDEDFDSSDLLRCRLMPHERHRAPRLMPSAVPSLHIAQDPRAFLAHFGFTLWNTEVMGMPIEGDLETMEKSQDSPDSALDSIGQQVQEPKENGEEESPKEAEEGENEAEKAISESSASPASKNDKLTEPKEPETGENRVEDGDVERKGSEEEEEEEEGSGGGGGGQGSHEDDEPGDGEVVQKDVEGDSDSQGSMTLKDSECQVSTSEAGNLGKRPLDENSSSASSEPKRPRLASPIPEELPQVKDMDTLENLMHSVRKEIRDLDTQVKEKEREWNYLIHLKKRKEEYYLRLKRKKAVEAMQTKSSSDKELLSLLQGPSGKPSSTTSPLLSAELRRCDPVSSRSASESLLSAELRRDASMPRVLTLNPESLYTTKPRVNLEAEQRMLLHEALYASKPKVSVDSLIAEHRARNPHPPELRGKRPRMRENPDKHSPEVEILVEPSSSKVIGSKEVSSSSAAGSGESSSSSSTKVLYRDMLVHLAKMSEGKSCVPLARPGPTPSSSTPRLNSAADSLQNISLKSLLDDTRKGKGKEGSNKVGESQPQPKCQGCKRSAAQFVCAGCNRQWYCSRECQVNDWDEHAEVCSG